MPSLLRNISLSPIFSVIRSEAKARPEWGTLHRVMKAQEVWDRSTFGGSRQPLLEIPRGPAAPCLQLLNRHQDLGPKPERCGCS